MTTAASMVRFLLLIVLMLGPILTKNNLGNIYKKVTVLAYHELYCVDHVLPDVESSTPETCAVAAMSPSKRRLFVQSKANGIQGCRVCSMCPLEGSLYVSNPGENVWALPNSCPGSLSMPPLPWPAHLTPSFYLSLDEVTCANMICAVVGPGKVGAGLVVTGSPSYAELVSTDLHASNPESFCWMAPDTCLLGATIAFWFQYNGADSTLTGILQSNTFPSTESNPPPANAFGIYYPGSNNQVFAYLAGNESSQGKNYYQVVVAQPMILGSWYHVTLTFSHDNGLQMCIDGTVCNWNGGKMETHTHTKITGRLEFGRGDDKYMKGTLDELMAFNQELSSELIQMLAQ